MKDKTLSAMIAVEMAMQKAERLGEDIAVMSDLSIIPLKNTLADDCILEIIRCPDHLKKQYPPV